MKKILALFLLCLLAFWVAPITANAQPSSAGRCSISTAYPNGAIASCFDGPGVMTIHLGCQKGTEFQNNFKTWSVPVGGIQPQSYYCPSTAWTRVNYRLTTA